jgi:hypothetical protein
MNTRQPPSSKEEHARRGDDIYERHARPHVEAGNLGKIVAIDVDTGAFEVAENTLTASNAQIWCIRIGHRGVHRFGWYPMVAGER